MYVFVKLPYHIELDVGFIDLFIYCVNATVSNSSAISWRPVFVVEAAGVPGENHRS